MSGSDVPAYEEFLFGRLSKPEGRVDEARRDTRGFFELTLLEPLDPRPGEPIRLRYRCGVDVAVDQVSVFWTTDGTSPAWDEQLNAQGSTQVRMATPLPPAWDTLSWDYLQDFEVELPACSDGTLVRYAAVGVGHGGGVRECPWPPRIRRGAASQSAVAVDRLEPPDWLRQAVIYQVFVDRFAPTPGRAFASTEDLNLPLGGTLWGLRAELDELVALGFDAIWLTPIFASPNYHGYAASDFFHVEPALGGDEAWRELVVACRARGVRLILDFVANHVSDRHPAFVAACAKAEAPQRAWFRFQEWPRSYDCFYNQRHQPELNVELDAVRDHLQQAACHWLGRGCDGFRLDYAHGLSHGFWSQFRTVTRKASPESVCLGEVTQTSPVIRSFAGRMDGCLDFTLCQWLRDAFAFGKLPLSHFARSLARHQAYFSDQLVLASFLDNHDMNRFIVAAGGDIRRLRVAALVQFLLPGPPILYYGTEVGLGQTRPLERLEEARLPMPPRTAWDHELREYFRNLIRLRKEVDPSRHAWELQSVDDQTRTAAWRIGSYELVVHCGSEELVVEREGELALASRRLEASHRSASWRLPGWTAAVFRPAGRSLDDEPCRIPRTNRIDRGTTAT